MGALPAAGLLPATLPMPACPASPDAAGLKRPGHGDVVQPRSGWQCRDRSHASGTVTGLVAAVEVKRGPALLQFGSSMSGGKNARQWQVLEEWMRGCGLLAVSQGQQCAATSSMAEVLSG